MRDAQNESGESSPGPSDRDREAARELLDRFRGQRIFQLDVADLAEFRAAARAEERRTLQPELDAARASAADRQERLEALAEANVQKLWATLEER